MQGAHLAVSLLFRLEGTIGLLIQPRIGTLIHCENTKLDELLVQDAQPKVDISRCTLAKHRSSIAAYCLRAEAYFTCSCSSRACERRVLKASSAHPALKPPATSLSPKSP